MIFKDIYSQTIKPASTTSIGAGGTNPQQIGLGVQISTIDVMHTKSTPQYTGNALDLSIEGDGYFIMSNSGQLTYTRAGNLYQDVNNFLVDASGSYVQGFEVDVNGDLVLDGNGDPIMTNIYFNPAFYDISINSGGQVVGIDQLTNESRVIGQIALATFANPNGLEKVGENTYRVTVNSGAAVFSVPRVGGGGLLNPGTLEMANVDLTSEFADMIVTQRGFQANSRIITTTDQMLEELVNMVR